MNWTNFLGLTIISILHFTPELEAEWNNRSALIVNQDPFYFQYYFPRKVVVDPRDSSLVYYRWTDDTYSISHYFCPNPEYIGTSFQYCLFGEEFFFTDKQPMKICEAPVKPLIVKSLKENKEIRCGHGDHQGILHEVRYEKTPWWNFVKKLKKIGKKKDKKRVYVKTVMVYQFCFQEIDTREPSETSDASETTDTSDTSDATEVTEDREAARVAEATVAVVETEPVETIEMEASRVTDGEQLYSYFKIYAPKLLKTELEFLLEEQQTTFDFDTNPYDVFEKKFFEEMNFIYEENNLKYFPQMLASPKFKAFALARKPHYHYLNVKPMLERLVAPWNATLENLKNKIAEVELAVSLYFGTFEIIDHLKMKNGRFLNVPGIWWILVYYKKSGNSPLEGVSIIMPNKMEEVYLQKPIYCKKSICSDAGLEDVIHETFIYCCPASAITEKLGLPEAAKLLKFEIKKKK